MSLLLIIATIITLSRQVAAVSSQTQPGDRLITVYDQGQEKTFVTNKPTIGSALHSAGLVVNEADDVEPSASTRLVAKNYVVNIYRARAVTVEDGAQRTQIITAAQSPRRILEQSGSKLYDEDTAKFELASSPLDDGGAGIRLRVDRATPFVFTLYGKTFEARTQATTVGDMLREKKIVLGANDGKSVSDETSIIKGMNISVWRNGKQTVTVEEGIARPVEEVKDTDRDKGYREVRTHGADGKKNVTYEIDIRDGREIGRKAIASVTTLEPVKEVVVIGMKVKAPVYSGTHADWMAAAGIAEADYGYVEKLIQKESGWNPNALNSYSGACGLVQALPCSKLGPNWNDPVVALRWGQGYVTGRYGGWSGAWAHSQSRGWY